jgi:hypothetical protein
MCTFDLMVVADGTVTFTADGKVSLKNEMKGYLS